MRMIPVNDIVHCLLCRGVFTFSDEAKDSIYKEHLKREHRAYFYVNWIIKKTLTEADNENKNRTDIRNYFKKKSPVLGQVKTQGQDGNNPATQSESCDTTYEISSFTDSEGQIEDLAQNENKQSAFDTEDLAQNENKQSSFDTEGVPIMMEDISAIEDVRIEDSNIDNTEDFTEIEDSIDNFTLKSFEQSNSESFIDSTANSFDDPSADFMDVNNSTSEPNDEFVDMDDSHSDFMNDSTLDSFNDSNADTFDDSSFDDSNADLLDDSSMDDSMVNSLLLESEESNEGTMGTTVTLSDHSLKTDLESIPNKPDSSNETIEISSFTDSEATLVSMQSSDNFENSASIVEGSNAKSGDDQSNAENNLVSIADHLPSLNEEPQKDNDPKLCESVNTQMEKGLVLQPCEESNAEPNEKTEGDKGVDSVKNLKTFIVRSRDEFHDNGMFCVEDNAELGKDSKADPCEDYKYEHHDNLDQSKDEFSVIQQTDNVTLCDDKKIISDEVDQAKTYERCNANPLEGDYSKPLEGGSDLPFMNVICEPIEDDNVGTFEKDKANPSEDGTNGPSNDGNDTPHEDTMTKGSKTKIDVKVDPCADVPTEPKEDIDSKTEPCKDIFTEASQVVNELPTEDNTTAQHEDINAKPYNGGDEEEIAYPSKTVKSNQDTNAVQDDHKDSHVWNEETFDQSDNWNDETFDNSIRWNDISYDETTTNNEENVKETGTRNTESYTESMAWNEESYNETDNWNEESYNETDNWNEESNNEISDKNNEPFKESNGWNEENYYESLDKNHETNNEKGDKNDEGYNAIGDTNEKGSDETGDWNEESYNETSDWNEESFNETGFWNGESYNEKDTWAEEAYVEKDDVNEKIDEHHEKEGVNEPVDCPNEDDTSYISQSITNSTEHSFANLNDDTLTDIYVHPENENKQLDNSDNKILENLSTRTLKASNTNDFNGEQNETTKPNDIDNISSENEISKKRHLPVDEEEIVPKKIIKIASNEVREDNLGENPLQEANNFEGKEEKEKSPLHERKNYACDQCSNRYISKFSLERHRSVCKGLKIRAFKKNYCNETFTSRDDLKLHQKLHNVADLNNADIVDAEIKDTSSLATVPQVTNEKVEKAKDEKPFSCDFCLKRFKTKWYAQMHKETKHSK